MDDKLIRFFNKINFEEIDDFEGVKVSKVVINKQKESWIVYLQSDKVVNPEAMIKLINKAKNGIENVNTIDIKTDYSNMLDEDIILRTWLNDINALYSFRQYAFFSATDKSLLFTGSTKWACIEIASGRPKRMSPTFIQAYQPLDTDIDPFAFTTE